MVNLSRIIQKISCSLTQVNTKTAAKGAEKTEKLIQGGNGFSRLKGVFKSNQNYKHYDEIVSTAKNKVVGNVPNEIIDLIVKNHPERKAEMIKSVQNAFGETAETLKLCQLAQIDAVKTVKGVKAEKDLLLNYISSNIISLKKSDDEIHMLKAAAKSINESLKGILPKGSKVKISHIGEGAFGNGYKLEMIDSAGNKIIHDRVLKVYKDVNLVSELEKLKMEKYKELLPKYSGDELWKVVPKTLKQKIDKKVFLAKIEEMKNNLEKMSPEKHSQRINSWISNSKDIHGAAAEANSVTRLKHILGHDISRTNAVSTDMFDLGKGFSLAQYSDDALPKAVSEINFKRLGLEPRDLHSNNYVNGKIIDFGNIVGVNDALMDKTVLKYYKQIFNRNNSEERLEVMFRLKRMAENPKTPLRNKIQQAVDIAQKELLFGGQKDDIHNVFRVGEALKKIKPRIAQMPLLPKLKRDNFVNPLKNANLQFKEFDIKKVNKKFAKLNIN